MTTGTYTPATLNDPLTVTYTAAGTCTVQISVELVNLASGDTLTVARSDNTTGTMVLYDDVSFTGAQDTSAKGYFVGLRNGEAVNLVLNQTGGTLRTFKYSIWSSLDG